MLTTNLIAKKRDGHELSDDEIKFLIDGFCVDSVADYQMAAFAMAVCIRGMNQREVATLTRVMMESGDRLPRLSSSPKQSTRPRVDKHSTGGLGDKVSLILAPLLAACDVDVPMISGRGLGLSGGTLDKLEAIEGFQTQLSTDQSSQVLHDVGAFIVGADESIAPADRRLYALRDVTATVESVPLITASILSKKLAANLDALVMDVKVGSGAFMKSQADAMELATSILRVAEASGLATTALITDMDQPLGMAVGNANEVNETVDVLQGKGPTEVLQVTIELAANLLTSVGASTDRSHAIDKLTTTLDSGLAMERFERMIHAQGGRSSFPLPVATKTVIESDIDGYVQSIDCQTIGTQIVELGGGRRRAGDKIDPKVGVEVHVRVGEKVARGQPILTLLGPKTNKTDYVKKLQPAIIVSTVPIAKRDLIIKRLGNHALS